MVSHYFGISNKRYHIIYVLRCMFYHNMNQIRLSNSGVSFNNILFSTKDWHDPRLTWSTEMYPNVGRLAFDESDVWIPDLTLYNK